MIEWALGALAVGLISALNDQPTRPSRTRASFAPRRKDVSFPPPPIPDQSDKTSTADTTASANKLDNRVVTPSQKEKPADDCHSAWLSTTHLGKVIGIKAKPYLFAELQRLGYIYSCNKKYLLTEKGKKFGTYKEAAEGERFVAWNWVSLACELIALKENIVGALDFRLYHMTHRDNLTSILESGLFSHNAAPDHKDISNRDINARRAREEAIHKRSLHDYVPLYFNPRNAMLYAKQSEYGNALVILEIDRSVCMRPFTLFSEKNAASDSSRLTCWAHDLLDFNWSRINAPNWKADGVANLETKSFMMSECLVHESIPTPYFRCLHVMDDEARENAKKVVGPSSPLPVKVSSALFFSIADRRNPPFYERN